MLWTSVTQGYYLTISKAPSSPSQHCVPTKCGPPRLSGRCSYWSFFSESCCPYEGLCFQSLPPTKALFFPRRSLLRGPQSHSLQRSALPLLAHTRHRVSVKLQLSYRPVGMSCSQTETSWVTHPALPGTVPLWVLIRCPAFSLSMTHGERMETSNN